MFNCSFRISYQPKDRHDYMSVLKIGICKAKNPVISCNWILIEIMPLRDLVLVWKTTLMIYNGKFSSGYAKNGVDPIFKSPLAIGQMDDWRKSTKFNN